MYDIPLSINKSECPRCYAMFNNSVADVLESYLRMKHAFQIPFLLVNE